MPSDPLLPGPLWMVGCGNMGSALLEGWIAAGVDPAHVTVVRPSGAGVGPAVRVLTDYPEDEVPALVVLAMKPHQLDLVAPALSPILDPRTILVSILAGVELATLRARFPAPQTVVRAMPNLAVSIGKGVVGLFGDAEGDPAARALVTGLMASLGHAEWHEDEALYQLAGIVTGTGPAFLFRFIEAIGDAAAALGMPADQAARLAISMVEGAAAYAAASAEAPDELARRVASPGGTTEAGLAVLDRGEALKALIGETVAAARARSLEMAAEARGRPS